jgi:hypothetical protein
MMGQVVLFLGLLLAGWYGRRVATREHRRILDEIEQRGR